jgi:dUTP pyrophosphatase
MSVLSQSDIQALLSHQPPLVAGFLDAATQLQPNGFDLTLRGVYRYEGAGQLAFDNSERLLPKTQTLEYEKDGFLALGPGCYRVVFNEVVSLPKDIMALGRPRSSLLRCGASLHTAVWDAGYSGRSESLLVVFNPHGLRLKKDARILQLVFWKLLQPSEGYCGKYQGENP